MSIGLRSELRRQRLRRRGLPVDARLVHVGAGTVKIPGWVDTDIDGSAPYYLDALRPWPVAGVTHVFADNVIEHFTLDDARQVLRHARAAMAPGGMIRLVTPDAETNARAYIEGGPDLEALLERHRANGYAMAYPADVLRPIFSLNGHADGYLFDERSLTVELEAAGFVDVHREHVGESCDEVFRGIDARTEPIDDLLLLTLEARTPTATRTP